MGVGTMQKRGCNFSLQSVLSPFDLPLPEGVTLSKTHAGRGERGTRVLTRHFSFGNATSLNLELFRKKYQFG